MEFFGCAISDELLGEFMMESSHPIYELEIFPLVVAVQLRSHSFVDLLVVHYIDNDAACSALIRADGSTGLAKGLVGELVDYEYRCKFSLWFACSFA